MKSETTVANFAVLLVSIIWGSSFLVIKYCLANVHAVTLVCYRFSLATLFMGIILIFLRKNPWQHLKAGLILGLLLFSVYVVQSLALYYIMVVDAGFIAGLFVIFVPILSFFCGHEKLQWNIIVAMILSGIGLWNVTGGIASFHSGDFLMLLSAVLFAVYILYADRVVKKCDIWVLNFQQFFVAALASFFSILLFKLPFAVKATDVIWLILYLTLFANVLSYMVQLWAQKIMSPIVCALIFSLDPIFAAIFAWTIGGEKMISEDIVGGLLIVTAIIIAQVFRPCEDNKIKLTHKK